MLVWNTHGGVVFTNLFIYSFTFIHEEDARAVYEFTIPRRKKSENVLCSLSLLTP